MAETALNLAAEQVIEWTANGHLLTRTGNRGDAAAPQGLYRVADAPHGAARWVALSVSTDEQWHALVGELGLTDLADAAELGRAEGRRTRADEIDTALRGTLAGCDADEVALRLRTRGVLASVLVEPGRVLQSNPQLQARGYFERPEHSVVGPMPIPSLPLRMSGVDAWIRTPAPLLGEHDNHVFTTLVPR
jgi:crotonobetainyl-CoA:carnitine CoA-transferase CaiB-like acyl-CoA transferase